MSPSRGLASTAAVAAAGLLLGAGYVYGGFVPRHPYAFLPAAVAGLAAAFAFGMRRTSDHRPVVRLRSGAAWAVLFAAAIPAAYLARWAWLYVEARDVPLPPGATLVSVSVDPVRFDGVPEWEVRFTLRGLPPERRRGFDVRSYHDRFAARDVALDYEFGHDDWTGGELWGSADGGPSGTRVDFPNGYSGNFVLSRNDRPPEWLDR